MSGSVLGGHLRRVARPAALSLGVLALLVLALAATGWRPSDAGARVQWRDDGWVVAWVDRQGPASQAGLRPGDVVVALDGAAPRARRRTDPALDLSSATEWTVLRGGERLALRPAWEDAWWHDLGEPAALLAVALAFWALSTFVRLAKPDDELARQFHRLNLAVAVALALSPAAGGDLLWAKAFEVLAFASLPGLFLGLFARFARGAPPTGLTRALVRGLSAVGLLAGGLYLLAGLVDSGWYYVLRAVLLGLLAAGIAGGLVALAVAYARPTTPTARRQVRVLLLGATAATLPLVALCLVPISLGLGEVVRPQYAALSTVFLPASFAYAILRHRLFDVDVFVERTLVYGAMTLLLAGCYALFLYGLSLAGPGSGSMSNPVLALAFFAAVTLTFVPVRDAVRQVVDRLVYRDRYDYARTLGALGTQLASVRPIREVLEVVAESLTKAMNLRGVAVLLREPGGGLAVRAAAGDYRDPTLARFIASQAADRLDGHSEGAGSGHWVALSAHGEESGLLYLGPKRRHAELTAEDLSLADTLASQAAMAIENALLIESLQSRVAELKLLRDRLLQLQADERRRLAEDLHDGALHTVLGLVRQGEEAARLALAVDGGLNGLGARLEGLTEQARDAVHELRTLCSDLYPSELAHLGLVTALESLARRVSRDENVIVHFFAHGFAPGHRLPGDLEDTLYRVAREAVENVCRHAEASVATVSLSLEGSQVTLVVKDDGQGFDAPATLGDLLRKGHIGLVSMRERVERLGGEFAIYSAPGRGTEVRARLPAVGGEHRDVAPPEAVR